MSFKSTDYKSLYLIVSDCKSDATTPIRTSPKIECMTSGYSVQDAQCRSLNI